VITFENLFTEAEAERLFALGAKALAVRARAHARTHAPIHTHEPHERARASGPGRAQRSCAHRVIFFLKIRLRLDQTAPLTFGRRFLPSPLTYAAAPPRSKSTHELKHYQHNSIRASAALCRGGRHRRARRF
jgi:hypothetical protein